MDFYRSINLVAVCGMFTSIGTVNSFMPSLFPQEAESKGATPSQFGLVFGSLSLACLLTAPIYGRYGSKIGIKNLCVGGGLVQGVCPIIFGLLSFVTDAKLFIALAYVVKFIEGLGQAALWSSMYAILMAMFPNRSSGVAAVQNVALGIGFTAGAPAGNALYSIGGYPLPFCISGMMILALTLVLFCTVDKVTDESEIEETLSQESIVEGITGGKEQLVKGKDKIAEMTYGHILKHAQFLFPLANETIALSATALIDSMLENHMMKSEAQGTQGQVANVFAVIGICTMVGNVVSSLVLDRLWNPAYVSFAASATVALAFSFLGPATYLPLAPSVSFITGASIFISLGTGAIVPSSYGRLSQAAATFGFAENASTNIMVAGAFIVSIQIGTFSGSTLSGILVEAIGFPATTVVAQVLILAFVMSDILQYFCLKPSNTDRAGYEKL